MKDDAYEKFKAGLIAERLYRTIAEQSEREDEKKILQSKQ